MARTLKEIDELLSNAQNPKCTAAVHTLPQPVQQVIWRARERVALGESFSTARISEMLQAEFGISIPRRTIADWINGVSCRCYDEKLKQA